MAYNDTPRKLYRSRHDSVVAGVCGGLANYFDFSPWGMRLIFILLAVFVPGITTSFMVVLYIVLALVLKPEPQRRILMPGEPDVERPEYGTRADALRRVQQRYEQIEQRLRRIESIVTRPGFDIDDQLRR